jgi:hypothetical protein
MKKLAIILILVLGCVAWGAEINTLLSLKTNFAAGGTHTIVANADVGSNGIYTLDADITCTTQGLTLTATEPVIIDGATAYNIRFEDNNGGSTVLFTVTGTATNTITFKRGDSINLFIRNDGAGGDTPIEAHFTYCIFRDSSAGNGLSVISNPTADVTVFLDYCSFIDNAADGFSFETGNTANKVCKAYITNSTFTGQNHGANDDGVTAHRTNNFLYVDNCTFNDNTNGVSVVGEDALGIGVQGASFYVSNSTFTNHACAIKTNSNNYFTGDVKNCTISAINAGGEGIRAAGGGLIRIKDTTIIGNALANNAIYGSGTLTQTVSLENCIIRDFTQSGKRAIETTVANKYVFIDHCTLYNNNTHVVVRNLNCTCQNTIFANATDASGVHEGAWLSTGGVFYLNNPLCGNNLFHNNAVKNFGNTGDVLASTDLTVDPQFVNAAAGDFRTTNYLARDKGASGHIITCRWLR